MFNVGPTFFSGMQDPYSNDVLLLLNATGDVTKDSSPFDNVMIAQTFSCTMYLDSSKPLFGRPSYHFFRCGTPPGAVLSSYLAMDNSFFTDKLGSNEFCLETYVNIYSIPPDYNDYEYSWYQSGINPNTGESALVPTAADACIYGSMYAYPSEPPDYYKIRLGSDGYCRDNYGTGARYIIPYAIPTTTTANGLFCDFSGIKLGTLNDTLFASVNIGGMKYDIGTTSGFYLDRWYHIALVRDNTTDPDKSILKLFIGGSLSAWTTQFISKNAELDAIQGAGKVIGYNGWGSFGHISNLRYTRNHARYYSAFNTPGPFQDLRP